MKLFKNEEKVIHWQSQQFEEKFSELFPTIAVNWVLKTDYLNGLATAELHAQIILGIYILFADAVIPFLPIQFFYELFNYFFTWIGM